MFKFSEKFAKLCCAFSHAIPYHTMPSHTNNAAVNNFITPGLPMGSTLFDQHGSSSFNFSFDLNLPDGHVAPADEWTMMRSQEMS